MDHELMIRGYVVYANLALAAHSTSRRGRGGVQPGALPAASGLRRLAVGPVVGVGVVEVLPLPPTEEPRPDASNARSQRPATMATGVSRALVPVC
jgi:hypothetical protein